MIDTIDDIPTMKATHNEKSWTTVLGIRLLGATGALFGITALFAVLVGALGLMADGSGMPMLGGKIYVATQEPGRAERVNATVTIYPKHPIASTPASARWCRDRPRFSATLPSTM